METVILFFSSYPFFVSFLGAFFGGEEVVLVLSYLSGQKLFPIAVVFIACVLGMIASDTVWYFLGRHRMIDWLLSRRYFAKGYASISDVLDKITKRNTFIVLLMLKFIYGIRIITLLYLSRGRMNFKTFSFYNIPIVSLWLAVVVFLGWIAGRGFGTALNIVEDVRKGVVALFLFLVLIHIIRIGLKRWLMRRIDTA